MPYSQNNEEAIIVEIFASKPTGRFLDIGAYDGRTFSNTLALAEKGWGGVCVEPSPTAFAGLLKVHGSNPRIICVNTAIAPASTWLEFFDSGGDAISSSNLAHVARWSCSANVHFTKFMLKTVSLNELLTTFGPAYDFINLDVEATNWNLFMTFPWAQLSTVRAVCLEHDGHALAMAQQLLPHGFHVNLQNEENIILSR